MDDAGFSIGTAKYTKRRQRNTPTCRIEESCLRHHVGVRVGVGGDGVVDTATPDVAFVVAIVHCHVLKGRLFATAELEPVVNGSVGPGPAAAVFSELTHTTCPRGGRGKNEPVLN